MLDAEDYPDDLADINLTGIEADLNFNEVMSAVCSAIEAGEDPTASALVQQVVKDFLNPPTPTPTPTPLSSDATLKTTSTVKGKTVASLGTPNATLGSVVAGSVTITPAKAADTSNTGTFITLFDKTNAEAIVKVVKYATAGSTAGFETDAPYSNEAIINLDFFIIKVTAEDTTTELYYKITVAVGYLGYFTFDIPTRTITDYDVAGGSDVVIPSEIDGVAVLHIGDGAFREKALTSVIIPDSVTNISEYAFYDNQLTSVSIPDSVLTIGDDAFEHNQLTLVSIGNSVTSIGANAFGINLLTLVSIGTSVTSIGDGAFSGNDLTTVSIPDSVTSIGDGAFQSNQLTSVTIGNGVTSIAAYVFQGNQITSVTIGSSVTSIGDAAFSDNQLTSVSIPDSVKSIGAFAFISNDLISVTIGAGVDINSNSTTMGTNTGFQAAYTAGGAGTYNYIAGAWVKRALVVGDSYGGGIVAYILQDGDPDYDANVQQGLIAATADQSTGIFWHATNDGTTGATAIALGTGNANTNTIVAFYFTESNAARLCYDLSLNGYSDWFLPSQDELSQLYFNRVAIGEFGVYAYWSSSECDSGSANAVFFDPVTILYSAYSKSMTQHVRAVRYF